MKKVSLNGNDLNVKNDILERIRTELKEEFYGIDHCIDKIVDSIKTWYMMPSIIMRPVIVNLWGMTGVGKTALVRSLVSKLGFSNRFVEIQMDTTMHSYETSICSVLESSSIPEDTPGIVFLDEFQRFRTIDNDGKEVKLDKYQDVWQLLSDGKFSSNFSILSLLEEELASIEYNEEDRELNLKEAIKNPTEHSNKIKSRKRRFVLSPWEARSIKKLLRTTLSTREIMTYGPDKIISLIEEYKTTDKNVINFNRCLIFIAGNLDEAFSMSDEVDDCDRSADAHHEHSMKIGVIEIKKALTKRFHPEQISRFGNNHIIYPSLNGEAYMNIIKRECSKYIGELESICNVKFSITKSMYDEIYENSVYPTQGTRPVFTSIHKIFASPLSDAVRWGITNNYKRVSIDMSTATSSVIFTNKKKNKLVVPVDLDIRMRREARSEDFNALIAIHEAGHALVYTLLFGMPPIEVAINATSFANGFNLFHTNDNVSKFDVLNKIATCYGGTVAEELIFGPDCLSTGCSGDIRSATGLASSYIRRWGLGSFSSMVFIDNEHSYNQNIDETNHLIEALTTQQKQRAQKLLAEHKSVLMDLSNELLKVKKMTSKTLFEFLEVRIPHIKELDDRDVSHTYSESLTAAV